MNEDLHRPVSDKVAKYASAAALSEDFHGLKGEEREALRNALSAAVLSGMSLACRWLIVNDGSRLTPQTLEHVVQAVAAEQGFIVKSSNESPS